MPDPLTFLLEKDRILDVVNRLFIGTDRRDWSAVKACFSERVLFDMSSMGGSESAVITPQQIVDGWDEGLKDLRAVHHQAGNYVVDLGDGEATVFCYGMALHYLPDPGNRNTRTFVGSYDLHLKQMAGAWRIDRFRFNLKFIDGNPDLGKKD